jgi:hypothetical protein
MMARANEIIEHYLSGSGSYWDEGPRKPLGEVEDLKNFRAKIDASKQFADDRGLIPDDVAAVAPGRLATSWAAARASERRADDLPSAIDALSATCNS